MGTAPESLSNRKLTVFRALGVLSLLLPVSGLAGALGVVFATHSLAASVTFALGAALTGLATGTLVLVGCSRSRSSECGTQVACSGLLLSFLLSVACGAGLPFAHRMEKDAFLTACRAQVRTIADGVLAHARDHGELLPASSTWCDAVTAYLPHRDLLICLARRDLPCGYAFNVYLGQIRPSQVLEPAHTVLVFESDMGWNAAGGRNLLPDQPRHFDGDHYGFADGHVQWLPRKKNPDGTWAREPDADWVIWEPVLKESEGEVSEGDEDR